MEDRDLAARVRRLEDVEAIKQLKARYCTICDDDHDPERITSVFSEDAIWEGRGIGRAEGHAAIRELFRGFQRAISYSQHMAVNPLIEVDGDTAKAVWYFFGLFTFRDGNLAKWQAARYHEDYVRVDGEWKIRHLRVKGPAISADYETGWARR
jgi:ketosteroid isomerase-like protein